VALRLPGCLRIFAHRPGYVRRSVCPSDPEYFTPTAGILDIVGNQATIAIQNAHIYRELEQEKERMMEIQRKAKSSPATPDGPINRCRPGHAGELCPPLDGRDPKAPPMRCLRSKSARRTKEIRLWHSKTAGARIGVNCCLGRWLKMQETYNQNVSVDADPSIIFEMEAGKQGVVFYIAGRRSARPQARQSRAYLGQAEISREELAGESGMMA
jgi:hypothetical protein